MKKILLSVFFILPILGLSQISYEFVKPLPPGGTSLKAPHPQHYGNYKSNTSEITFVLNAQGVFTLTTIVGSISKDSVNHGGNYSVRNNYIFGVHKTDSIRVALEGSRYYFNIEHKEEVIGPNSKNVLSPVSGQSYLLNFYEDVGYVPCLFSIVDSVLAIQYFDYDSNTDMFSEVPKTIKRQGKFLTIFSLNPAKEDFADLNFTAMFNTEKTYKLSR